MFQNGQKVVVVSSGDERRVIKVQSASGTPDPSRYPIVDTTGVTGRDQQVQIVSGGDPTRFPILRGVSDARATADSVITALSPAAWYRNATDVVSSGGFASIWADYASSAKGLVLPGVVGNSASTVDAVAVSPTSEVDIRVKCALVDYTPTTAYSLVQKFGSAGNRSFMFYISATGILHFWFYNDGTTAVADVAASAATGVTDGDTTWLRVTFDGDNGAGGYEVKFWKSSDDVTYSQIGTTQTGGATSSIFDGTAALEIGGTGGGAYFNGVCFRASLRKAIDATPDFDADFSAQAIGAGSFTESSSNAATVTINASGAAPAHIGKARDLLQGTGTNQPAYAAGVFTLDGADNYMAAALALSQPITVVLVGSQVSWTANDTIYDGVTGNTMRCYQRTATPTISQYAGLQGGQDANWAVGADGIVVVVFSGASSTIRVNNNAKTTGSAGTSASDGFTLGAFGGGASFANITAKEAVLFGAALSDANVNSIVTAYNSLFTVF